MKKRKRMFRPYGLHARFALFFGAALLLCTLVFLVLYTVADYSLKIYIERPGFTRSRIQKQGENLQMYIRRNSVSSKNLQKLKDWEYEQPLILLEVYSGGKCLYSSFYDVLDQEFRYDETEQMKEHTITVSLADMEAQVVLYSDFTYQYHVIGTVVSAGLALILFFILFRHSNQKLIHYICRLNEEVQILEGGNLEYQMTVEGNDELTDLAKSMERMRESFLEQIETEENLHRINRKLVTEMSHDLRTPLTGVLLYLEILRSHRYTTETERQYYLEKIEEKAQYMKRLSDHLVENAMTEAAKEELAPWLMKNAFESVISRFLKELTVNGFTVAQELTWISCFVDVNDEYVRRIFENILSNVIKYAEPATEVTVRTIDEDMFCGFSILNICSDSICRQESTGIGIESIRTMMLQMKGLCMVEQTETAFEITLLFPKQ